MTECFTTYMMLAECLFSLFHQSPASMTDSMLPSFWEASELQCDINTPFASLWGACVYKGRNYPLSASGAFSSPWIVICLRRLHKGSNVLKCCSRNCYLWRELCYLLTMPNAERSPPLEPPDRVRLRRVSVCKLTLTLPLTATLFNKLVAEDRSEKTQKLWICFSYCYSFFLYSAYCCLA